MDRKKHIIEQFEKHNITDYEFIERFNKEDLCVRDRLPFDYSLQESMISIINKHFYAYKQISKHYDSGLIFEDDVILSDDFVEKLNKYMTEIPDDYDMLFIGDGCGFHIEKDKLIPGKHIYEKCLQPTKWGGDGATRCADSYIISKKCAIQLCDYIWNLTSKINMSTDWWLNIAARDNNFKAYWAEPTIVTQGSESGLFAKSY